MKNITTILFFLFTISVLSQENNEKTQLFKTDLKANVTVNDSINLDDFKEIAIIPGGHFRKDLQKINYFSKIMTEKEFMKEIKQAVLDTKKYNFDSQEGVENVFRDFKKFIYVFQSIRNEDATISLIVITNPIGKTVFEVEGKQKTNVVGISAGTRFLPEKINNAMLNELVDFIRRNSNTY